MICFILNFGNLLNSDWGIIQQPNSVQPIGVTFPDANPDPNVYEADRTQNPIYSFNGDQQKTFGFDSSLASRWQAQFGLRYIF